MGTAWRSDSDLLAFLNEYFRGAPNPDEAMLKVKLWLGAEIKKSRRTGRGRPPKFTVAEILGVPEAPPERRREPAPLAAGRGSGDRWLTATEAAAYLGQRVKTLSNWRSKGTGPRFAKRGGTIRYRKSDLDAWLEGGMSL